ncbi:hypothetical protein V6615_00065 [Oscillospiraceae bacterium PP1C4]
MKNSFDEMQEKKRNQIGTQSFSLLVLLLMLDNAAFSFGFRWIAYPANILILAIGCCGLFVVRCVLNGSFIAPRQNIAKSGAFTIVVMIISMVSAITLSKKLSPPRVVAESSDKGGALLLAGISYGFLILAAIIYFVKRHRDNKNND